MRVVRQQEAEKRCRTVHHRESSGGLWRAWLMDRRQDCPDKSSKHLRRSPAVLVPALVVGGAHLGAFPELLALALFILTQNGQNVTRTRAGACCALQVGFQI